MRIDQNNIAQLSTNRTAKDMIEFVLSINLSPDNNPNHQCDNCTENQAIEAKIKFHATTQEIDENKRHF